jgi:hypothetical protein
VRGETPLECGEASPLWYFFVFWKAGGPLFPGLSPKKIGKRRWLAALQKLSKKTKTLTGLALQRDSLCHAIESRTAFEPFSFP